MIHSLFLLLISSSPPFLLLLSSPSISLLPLPLSSFWQNKISYLNFPSLGFSFQGLFIFNSLALVYRIPLLNEILPCRDAPKCNQKKHCHLYPCAEASFILSGHFPRPQWMPGIMASIKSFAYVSTVKFNYLKIMCLCVVEMGDMCTRTQVPSEVRRGL